MIDTSDKNFNINLNINIKNIRTRYQYQYQYCRIQNSISISIPIPKMIKFKLNLKTIPRYLDILRSQANTQKIRASIAQLWFIYMTVRPPDPTIFSKQQFRIQKWFNLLPQSVRSNRRKCTTVNTSCKACNHVPKRWNFHKPGYARTLSMSKHKSFDEWTYL